MIVISILFNTWKIYLYIQRERSYISYRSYTMYIIYYSFPSKQLIFSGNNYVLKELVSDYIRNCESSLSFTASGIFDFQLNSFNVNQYSHLFEGHYD